jgi:EF hand domain-containing protein
MRQRSKIRIMAIPNEIMKAWARAQDDRNYRSRRDDEDRDNWRGRRGGDRRSDWWQRRDGSSMRDRMMGDMMSGGGMMSRGMRRMMFILMDADGDGTVSLQEFQSAHERIFKAMDADKDGKLSMQEIQSFMRGQREERQQ